jgi:hypothetical protein
MNENHLRRITFGVVLLASFGVHTELRAQVGTGTFNRAPFVFPINGPSPTPTPVPTPPPTPKPLPPSSTSPIPFGLLPFATIDLQPSFAVTQSSWTQIIPDDDGSGNVSFSSGTTIPKITAQKISAGGTILLIYNPGTLLMPVGYVWRSGLYTTLNQNPDWAHSTIFQSTRQQDVSLADVNDPGVVVGTVRVFSSLNVAFITGNIAAFSQPVFWNAGSSDLSKMGLPSDLITVYAEGETAEGSELFSPGEVNVHSIGNNDAAFGSYDTGSVDLPVSEVTLKPDLERAIEWSASPSSLPTAIPGAPGDLQPVLFQVAATSADGKHVVTHVDGRFELDSQRIPFLTGTPTIAVNNGGRIIAGTNWSDGLLGLTPISSSQNSGPAQGLTSTVAISNNNEILGLKSDGTHVIYTWTAPPVGSSVSSTGFYTENLVDSQLRMKPGWVMTAIASAISDSRGLVGQIKLVSDANGVVIPSTLQVTDPALFIPATLLVDVNRDSIIDNSDVEATSGSSPFRFWINDGIDGNSTLSNLSLSSLPTGDTVQADLAPESAQGPNYQQGYITCTRDLENFARLWLSIGGLSQAISSRGITVGLEWHSNSGDAVNGWGPNDGAPAINIYLAAPNHGDPTQKGTSAYLTDPATASDQSSLLLYQYTLGQVAKGAPLYLPASSLTALTATNPNAYFLFEGAARGTGRLVITFNTGTSGNYTKIGESGGLYMDLKDIKELYERWTVGDGSTGLLEGGGGVPLAIAGISEDRLPTGVQSGLTYSTTASGLSVPSDSNANSYILFVHGWNLPPWEKDAFAETALKRLYWQGYKGKFGTFQWPTTYYETAAALPVTCYDDGEFTAWQSAVPLEQLLVALHGGYGSNVYVLAHSMGNVVTGEALRLAGQNGVQLLVNTYVATQAAVPGACNDPLLDGEDPLPTTWGSIKTPNIYDGWLASGQSAVGARADFCNVNDFALTLLWEPDQETKPDSGYSYAGTDFSQIQDLFETGLANGLHLGNSANVQDRYQIMAYAAQPRSLALGAVLDVSSNAFGPTQSLPPSGTQAGVWPTDTFNEPNGLYSSHVWHSAEFLFANSDQQNYWNTLMKRFGLPTNQ